MDTPPTSCPPLPVTSDKPQTVSSGPGRFAIRHANAILFISISLCAAGIYSALHIPSAVFPQTDFPRVVINVDNGVMPANEMMATVTRPIETSMKDIPGVTTIRTLTGRGSAEINVFFNWKVNMVQSELFVIGRLSQIRSTLPSTAETDVHRLTFAQYPVLGISLTSETRDLTHLWETASHTLSPRFLRVKGVARVDIIGGRTPEYHIVVDPHRLQASGLSLAAVTEAFAKNNLVTSAGLHEEKHMQYLAVVDGRARSLRELEDFAVGIVNGHIIRIRDFARVERGPEPAFNVVTADGREAVLLNIKSQPDGSTLDIAKNIKREMASLRRELPPDMKLAFFYDQSLIVRDSVRSVWEAIGFGLLLSVLILFAFLKNWGTTIVAALVIPVTVLLTLVAVKLTGMSFNLMTLGGIAAAIGLVIDDAIVVVESIHTKMLSGISRALAVEQGVGEILMPLVASTLTPVVVFIPLAFLTGITGVFFRALALTMAVALLTSLALAVTITPSLAAAFIRTGSPRHRVPDPEGGPVLRAVVRIYEATVRTALEYRWVTLALSLLLLTAGIKIYTQLESEFLPTIDEGGHVIDYVCKPGTSLAETARGLQRADEILRSVPEVESYSRRTGAALGEFVVEPHSGDYAVKLSPNRTRKTEEIVAELRKRLNAALPNFRWEFPGILNDLIGDLMKAPNPIEVRIFSSDIEFLKKKAVAVEEAISKVRGVVDTSNGLVITGPTLSFRLRPVDARRFGLTADDVAAALKTAMLGETPSSVIEGDWVIKVRIMAERSSVARLDTCLNLPLRTLSGASVKLSQVADVAEEPGQFEMQRDDLRQDVVVSARLEGRDLGGAMAEIRELLSKDPTLPPGTVEFGGLYQQQQESFRNLMVVLALAVLLVFTVLLIEFRSFSEPLAIIFGAVLSISGAVMALLFTDTALNVMSFLGAIIGVGIVAKNGILMLDCVKTMKDSQLDLDTALVRSGRRRLRPVLMTSLAAALGMLPLAYGLGSGSEMLKPLAIAVIGSLCISVLLSLIATPVLYSVLLTLRDLLLSAKTADPAHRG